MLQNIDELHKLVAKCDSHDLLDSDDISILGQVTSLGLMGVAKIPLSSD